MRDVAAEILARLFTILQGIDGVATKADGTTPSVWRDRQGMPEEVLPAIVLLDGAERKHTVTRGTGGRGPQEMILEPEIWVQLKQADNLENAGKDEELKTFRQRVLKAIMNDATLAGIQGEGMDIDYRGYDTDMRIGSDIEGNMILNFGFSYLFDRDDLN